MVSARLLFGFWLALVWGVVVSVLVVWLFLVVFQMVVVSAWLVLGWRGIQVLEYLDFLL